MKRLYPSALAISILFCAGMWVYVSRVLVAHQKDYAASHGVPRGNLSDLYPRWLGSRELLLHGRDPYSADVTREIQSGYYGRPLDAFRPNDPQDQGAFAYPVYVAFVLAPTVKMSFPLVQEFFRWVLAGLTVWSVLLWLRVVRWRTSWITAAIVVFLTLATFPAVQGIRLQQLSLLVAALIAGSVYLLTKNRQVPAGILLALATIKPQLALPLAAWLLLWSVSRFSARWKFAASFVMTSVALVLGGEVLLPGWIREFYFAIIAYRNYTHAGSILEQLAGRPVGAALMVVVGLAVAWAAWRARSSAAEGDADSEAESHNDRFCWTTSLVLAGTVVIVPSTAPYNQLLLLPGCLLIAQTWTDSEQISAAFRALRAIATACVCWPWISAATLALASLVTPAAQRFWQVPLWTSLLLPIPLAACLGLYAVNPGIRLPQAPTGH